MELGWGVGVVILGIGCFGDGVSAADDLMMEVRAWSLCRCRSGRG